MIHRELAPRSQKANELYGDYWFNGGPVLVSALQGSAVLVFFWDYACAGSLRSLPYLMEWHRKYTPFGLAVVGVHTPRYAFERDPQGVQDSLQRLHISFPVVMDNDGLIASRYEIRSCPSFVLIDRHGYIRLHDSGGGNYLSIERALQGLLYDIGPSETLPFLTEPLREMDREGAVCYRSTPDIEAGYLRGSLGNVEGYIPESSIEYVDPGMYLDGRLYAKGIWRNNRESLSLDTDEKGDGHIFIEYQGLDVLGVLSSSGSKKLEVVVQQDDRFLTSENKGEDVRLDSEGKSCIEVGDPRLYSIVKNMDYGEHLLHLTAQNVPLTVYAFAFGTSVISEMVSKN